MGARRWPWIAGASAALLALASWWIVQPSKERIDSEGVLLRSSTIPEDHEALRAAMEGYWSGDLPAGYCFLRFPRNSVLRWNGRRMYAFELVSHPEDRVRVTVWRDGRPRQRLDSPAPPELPIVVEAPFWGVHDYRFDIHTAGGGTM